MRFHLVYFRISFDIFCFEKLTCAGESSRMDHSVYPLKIIDSQLVMDVKFHTFFGINIKHYSSLCGNSSNYDYLIFLFELNCG